MTDRVLLPTNVKPSKYEVHLTPDLKNFTFDGSQNVFLDVKQATSTIVLHSLELEILEVEFQVEGQSAIKSKSIEYDEKLETATITFESSLPVGKGIFRSKFKGILNNKMLGFYRSSYTVGEETRYLATTQMEPTGCRKAFPSWDEPALKATFVISLTSAEHLVSLSNMDPITTTVDKGLKTVTFAETPIMSTYLVAFIVGEFDYVEDHTKEGTRIRVYTPPGKKEQGRFALDVAVKCLSYYNDYYQIPYPLPKLDQAAIPDFAAGAMENWGLVTYRTVAILVSEETSKAVKQRVAYIVAHELAHQWFGNLVTMEWWKELWLNEGFATFMGMQATDALFPEWDIWSKFVVDYWKSASDLDSLENSHPIEVEVSSSAQIDEIFDNISYAKGACVIRMLTAKIGEANFKKGLTNYLNKHKYSNAVTTDLWEALSETAGFDVSVYMKEYTKITGFPMISVQKSKEEGKYDIKQARFFQDGRAPGDEKWWVSLGVKDSKSTVVVDLKEREATVALDVKDWFILNAEQSGFYRVRYDPQLIPQISSALQNRSVNAAERMGILIDAFTIAQAGFAETVSWLELVKALDNEDNLHVWKVITSQLLNFAAVYSTESSYPHLQKFAWKVTKKIFDRVGFEAKEGEPENDAVLRGTLISFLVVMEEPNVLEECNKRFETYLKSGKILADIRGSIFASAALKSDENYAKLKEIYHKSDNQEEKIAAIRGLASTRNPKLIDDVIEFGFSVIRPQDYYYIPFAFGSNPSSPAAKIHWKYVTSNWKRVNDVFAGVAMMISRIVEFSITGNSSKDAEEVKKFFEQNPCPAAERTIAQCLETILSNEKWLNSSKKSVNEWFSQQ